MHSSLVSIMGILWSLFWIETALTSIAMHLVSKHTIECRILLATDNKNNSNPLNIWRLCLLVLAFPRECINMLGSEVKSIHAILNMISDKNIYKPSSIIIFVRMNISMCVINVYNVYGVFVMLKRYSDTYFQRQRRKYCNEKSTQIWQTVIWLWLHTSRSVFRLSELPVLALVGLVLNHYIRGPILKWGISIW